jgi:hypothetical protein
MALAEAFDEPERPELRVVESEGRDVCPDCRGSLVVVDDDGSVSGMVGTLIDCICVALAVPPGFVECHECAALVPVPDAVSARHNELVGDYLAFCASTGTEPAWCLHCGDYRPLVNGARSVCGCSTTVPAVVEDDYSGHCRREGIAPVRERLIYHLGSFQVEGPWGIER